MTRQVEVGGVKIGGGAPVSVQSMLCVPWQDADGNIEQAKRLKAAGCDIIRVAVPEKDAAPLVGRLKEAVGLPIVADIHFDYRLALAAIECGADKIRINPGNIGGAEKLRPVVEQCARRGVPIRVGVNSGSLEKELLERFGGPTAAALAESALNNAALVEDMGWNRLVVSIKSTNVRTMVEACRIFAKRSDIPQHIGVTEAGTYEAGIIKSSIGIGSLLLDGIGDTLRVSLTDAPEREVAAGIGILRAVGLRRGVNVISCPTCGRTQIDLMDIARRVNAAVAGMDKQLTVAVMGCVVNGPGEAEFADIGIAGGKDCAVLFKKGKTVRNISGDIAAQLIEEIKAMG